MDLLDSIKALYSVIIHSVGLIGSYRRNCLHEAHHSPVAVSVKFVVVPRLERLKLFRAILGGIFRNLRLDGVFEVGQEPQSILQLDLEGLVVDGRPSSCNLGGFALAALGTVSCLRQILVHQFDFPRLCIIKAPLVVIRYNLKLVRQLMRADLVHLEQVDLVSLLRRVEVPHSVDLAPQAVDGLVCSDLAE